MAILIKFITLILTIFSDILLNLIFSMLKKVRKSLDHYTQLLSRKKKS